MTCKIWVVEAEGYNYFEYHLRKTKEQAYILLVAEMSHKQPIDKVRENFKYVTSYGYVTMFERDIK